MAILLISAPAVAAGDGLSDGPAVSAVHSEPGDVCENGSTSYYWTLEDRFTGNESYRVLCKPSECGGCEGGWQPVSVTMYLYWEEQNDCALSVRAEIHEVDPAGATQGRLVAVSERKTVGPFRPAGLWAVTVAMPLDSPTITGPCYATLSFLDTCEDLPSVVAAPGACNASRAWNDRGDGWVDVYDQGLPGNLSVFATFECQLTATEEPVAWSTIKTIYGNGQ